MQNPLNSWEEHSVDENWNEFTRILNDIIKKYVPEKVIKDCGYPWITHKIIKMMRQ